MLWFKAFLGLNFCKPVLFVFFFSFLAFIILNSNNGNTNQTASENFKPKKNFIYMYVWTFLLLYETKTPREFLCFCRVIVNGFNQSESTHFPFLFNDFFFLKGVFINLARKQLNPRKPFAPGESAETNAIDRQNNIVGRIFGHIFVPKRHIIRGTSMFITIEHMLRITPDLHLPIPVLYMARVWSSGVLLMTKHM